MNYEIETDRQTDGERKFKLVHQFEYNLNGNSWALTEGEENISAPISNFLSAPF